MAMDNNLSTFFPSTHIFLNRSYPSSTQWTHTTTHTHTLWVLACKPLPSAEDSGWRVMHTTRLAEHRVRTNIQPSIHPHAQALYDCTTLICAKWKWSWNRRSALECLQHVPLWISKLYAHKLTHERKCGAIRSCWPVCWFCVKMRPHRAR